MNNMNNQGVMNYRANRVNYKNAKDTSCNPPCMNTTCEQNCANTTCEHNRMNTSCEQKRSPRNITTDKFILMKNIFELGFVLTETNLYLDTHPDDMEAIEYYTQIKEKYSDYMTKYADYYGPLDKLHMSNDNYWMWVATPMPWEMEDC